MLNSIDGILPLEIMPITIILILIDIMVLFNSNFKIYIFEEGFNFLTDLHSLKDKLDILSSGKQTVLLLNTLKMMINLWKARRPLS